METRGLSLFGSISMSCLFARFRTRQNQLGGLGLRGTMPIGVKVYTASPRWL
jgi:hypothetical protein